MRQWWALGLLIGLATLRAAPLEAQEVFAAVPSAVAVTPGQRVTIALNGSREFISATASAPVVDVVVNAAAHALELTGRTLGNAIVHVSNGASAVDIYVAVLPAAGTIPAHMHVAVTGNPATKEFLRAQIFDAITRAIAPTLTPGSIVHTPLILPLPQELGRGFLTSFSVPASIEPAPGTLGSNAAVAVDVRNVALPPVGPAILAFTDDPERITADGVLSRTTVDASRPARLYYYHENVGALRRFCVVLSANDSVRTHIHMVGASAGPNIDVMSVGHAVTKSFLTVEPNDEGSLDVLAGGKPVIERDTPIGPGDGIVGSLDLRVLDGGPVTVTIMAIPPAAQPAAYLYAAKLADDGHQRHGTFAIADFAQRIVGYSTGARDATYVYGSRQVTPQSLDATDPGHDFGDYGVVQHATFDVINPSPATATVYLYEKPLGGAVRSSFVVNGTIVEIGCVRVAQRYRIAGYQLAPHATTTVDVLTMTDGGSNYPLEIGLTATPPLPSAPPISAADGCFPKPGGAPAAAQPASGPTGH